MKYGSIILRKIGIDSFQIEIFHCLGWPYFITEVLNLYFLFNILAKNKHS
jgi:hypothetical protein